jgi:phosphatidylserine/phosphatidylglycerophosphate/cardiolipin synthase-like enzyme
VGRLADRIARLPTATAAGQLSAPTPRERVLLHRLVELWTQVPDLDPAALSLALRAAQRTAAQVAGQQTIELVWTGPRTDDVPVRRNDQALQEVIASAERELLLVSYAVYNVPKIAEGLAAAVARGAAVQLVLEFHGAAEGDQTYDPLVALGELPQGVHVFHWPFEKRPRFGPSGKRGFIHVKCAVADRRLAFVSSANLTAYAMEANMELGVLIRGGLVPQRIAAHFEQLVSKGVLEPRYLPH